MNVPDSLIGLAASLPKTQTTDVRGTNMLMVGGFVLGNRIALAPMAGVTDYPFRRLCRTLGAGYAVAEMTSAQLHLYRSAKSRYRMRRGKGESPFAVQIVGSDAQALADAARFHADQGADIIDINMGCPAKKLLKKAAGSALLGDEKKVADILGTVVCAVSIPVTLKFRTGIHPQNKNAVRVARIAEEAGIALLALHGRTRDCLFRGEAEYDTIREVKAAVGIPVLANGDIHSVDKARRVMAETGVDGVMIGRAAVGRPWFFYELAWALSGSEQASYAPLSLEEKKQITMLHLDHIHAFYGEKMGVRRARKHLLAYARYLGMHLSTLGEDFYTRFMATEDAAIQKRMWQTVWQEINTRAYDEIRLAYRKVA